MTARPVHEDRILWGVSYEPWPSPDARRGPLPRLEDLPIGDQGYDQEAVREAFDAFYRHAAQLDASLRALEAVEVFRREANDLRADLRSLRSLGFGGEPGWAPALYSPEQPRRDLPAALPRVAAEAALVIAVGVVAGVGHFRPWIIGAAIGGAWLVVMLSEFVAARARYSVPEPYFGYAAISEAIASAEEVLPAEEPVGWAALEPAPEPSLAPPQPPPLDEQTMPGEPPGPAAAASAEDGAPADPEPPSEHEPAASAPAEPAVDEEPARRRRWFHRDGEAEPEPVEPALGQVGVVEAEPWERGFDGDDAEAPAAAESPPSLGSV